MKGILNREAAAPNATINDARVQTTYVSATAAQSMLKKIGRSLLEWRKAQT
jgi:hypothetical protein